MVPFTIGSSSDVDAVLALRRTPEHGAEELDDPHDSAWWPLLEVGDVAVQHTGEGLLDGTLARPGDAASPSERQVPIYAFFFNKI